MYCGSGKRCPRGLDDRKTIYRDVFWVKGNLGSFANSELLSRHREEINTENRYALSLLAVMGLPLSAVNFIAQLLIAGDNMPIGANCMLFGYFLFLLALDRLVLPKTLPHATLLLYVIEFPPILLAVLLGTVWDPNHQATTILMFLMAMPVFILDRPVRTLGVSAVWALLFLPICAYSKSEELFMIDAVHVAEFYIASAAIFNVVLRVRLKFLENLSEARYQLNHDRQTDCLSRYALETQTEHYLNKPLILFLADLDQLTLYKDFYGHNAADAMLRCFASALRREFGSESSYRYGGDEILCVCSGASLEGVLARIGRCRDKLHSFEYEGKRISLSFAAGYVTGTPKNEQEFRGMIQLADIYAHRARQNNLDCTLGDSYDEEKLHQGIVDSNLSGSVAGYDVSRLTGLPGMSFFIARSNDLMANILSVEQEPVIGYIKLLHMRDFNNEFGYAQGDELIAHTAKLLREVFPQRQLASITAGQFCLLAYKNEVEEALRRLTGALQGYKPGYPVEVSAGFAQYHGTESAIALLDMAKIAQKSVRLQSGESFRFYDASMDEEHRFRQYILNHVDEAVEKNYLRVYYQPIARAMTGEVCNEEALCRWIDPRYGFLMPYRFIPTLEDNALMYKVNLHVLRQVLADFDKKRSLGVPIVPVSINLSRRDFEQCDMVEEITRLVDASGYPRSFIKIEITESAFISNPETLKHEVERFHEKGFDVWLDDFGSEYSTLNLLQELDFDLLKIDMQFMKNFTPDGKNYIIVSDIIDMAKRMGVTTLIEGIETREHLTILRRLGCEKIQGYLFNKPNSLDYIVERALAGTGLTFEDPAAVPYYEDIGRIDLSEPLSSVSIAGFASEIPAGVIEKKDGRFRILRWTERFLELLRSQNVLEEGTSRYPLLREPAPERFLEVLSYCEGHTDWLNYDRLSKDDGMLSVYMRRISEHSYRGAVSFLTVVLPGRSNE